MCNDILHYIQDVSSRMLFNLQSTVSALILVSLVLLRLHSIGILVRNVRCSASVLNGLRQSNNHGFFKRLRKIGCGQSYICIKLKYQLTGIPGPVCFNNFGYISSNPTALPNFVFLIHCTMSMGITVFSKFIN